jgi:hypothetical protein
MVWTFKRSKARTQRDTLTMICKTMS